MLASASGSWSLLVQCGLFILYCLGTAHGADVLVDDAFNASDIANCKPELGRFICKSENQCILGHKVCNQIPDCTDGSDEFPDCDKPCKRVRCSQGCVPHPDSTKQGRCYCKKGYRLYGTNRDRCSNINECELWDTCSQECEDTEGSYDCSCQEGFQLGKDNRTCTPLDPEVRVVYALKGAIRVWSSSAKRHFSIVENQGQTVGVAVDVKNDFVFWTDVREGNEAIYRAKVNGEGPIEKIVDSGLVLPEGIAFDWITGNIYFTDSNRSHIVACNGDGKFCAVVIENADKPREIALHPSQGLMFWSDWGDRASIIRASMDGSTPLPIITSGLRWPNGLAVDHGNSRLYWSDAYYDKIETSTLTGGDRHSVIADGVHHPFSLEVFGDTLYWSDWHLSEVETCTKFACKTPHAVVAKDATSGYPNGIAVFHQAAQPVARENPCATGKCSHICVLSGLSNFVCLCPAGMMLDKNRKTCIDDDHEAQLIIAYDNNLNTMRFGGIGRDIIEERTLRDIKNIGAVVYNPINDTIFISDLFWKTIFEYDRKTGRTTSLMTRHLDSVKCMALDVVGQNLYWGDSSRRKVEVMSLRTGAKALIAMEAEHPQDIIVVPEIRSLFIALTGRRGGRILKMDMNGYRKKTLVRVPRIEPVALAYNTDLGRIFWADAYGESVEHISPSGDSQSVSLRSLGHPYSLTSFGNRVFWSDSYTQQLHVIPVFGMDQHELPFFIGRHADRNKSSHESYITGNFLAKISIIHKDISRYENLTKNHECSVTTKTPKCSHICLLSRDLNVGTCVCPEGMQLDKNGKTCSLTSTCFGSQFQCSDRCIDGEFRCDGINDCSRGEDEQNCDQIKTCRTTDFTCETDKTCISMSWRCDGDSDCADGSDERGCDKGSRTCDAHAEFQCDDGQCIPKRWKCDHQYDCKDRSDEKECSATCPLGSFQCNDLACISTDWVCDGDYDCNDQSDEHEGCDITCANDSFRCLNHHCINSFLVCNGVADCSDNSDELECGTRRGSTIVPVNQTLFNVADDDLEVPTTTSVAAEREACPWNRFTCDTGECLPLEKVCDQSIDCKDGSDEGAGCFSACQSHNCQHTCQRTPQGPKCTCGKGFEPDERDKRSCVDIDECAVGHPCDHFCLNTKGSFKCSCKDDYLLRSDQRRCKPKHKKVKTHFINSGSSSSSGETSSEEKSISGEKTINESIEAETVFSEESREDTSSSSTVGIVFGVIFILLVIAVIVGFILHKQRIHPKVLFERYGQQIMVRFKPRPRAPRREQLGSEAIYDDVCDSRTYASGTYANPVNRNGDSKENPHSLADSGILNVMDTDPNHLYEDLDDHFIAYSQRDTLLDKEFV